MIKDKVQQLCKKHQTRDPFIIARQMGILVIHEELGSISGYYNKILRMKQIHINHNLPDSVQRFTCAHELGHALLHPEANTPFLMTHTFFSISRMEHEANKFASELLIPDSFMEDNASLTMEQLARMLNYDVRLVELKLKRRL